MKHPELARGVIRFVQLALITYALQDLNTSSPMPITPENTQIPATQPATKDLIPTLSAVKPTAESMAEIPLATQIPTETPVVENYETSGLKLEGQIELNINGFSTVLDAAPMRSLAERENVMQKLADWESFPNLAPVSPTNFKDQYVIECHSQRENLPCDSVSQANYLNIGESWTLNGQSWMVQDVKHITRDEAGIAREFSPDGEQMQYNVDQWGFETQGHAIYLVTCFGAFDSLLDDYVMTTVVKLVPASEYQPSDNIDPRLAEITNIADLVNNYNSSEKLGTYLVSQGVNLEPTHVRALDLATYPYFDPESAIQCVGWVNLLSKLHTDGPRYIGDQAIVSPADLILPELRKIRGEMRTVNVFVPGEIGVTLKVGTDLKIEELQIGDTIITYSNQPNQPGHAWVVVGTDNGIMLSAGNPPGQQEVSIHQLSNQEQLLAFLNGWAGFAVLVK